MDLWQKTKLKYLLVRDIFPDDQRHALERDYSRFEERMKTYKRVLDLRPIEQRNLELGVVRGFLTSGPTHIADFLFPITFANQSDAVLENMIEAIKEFFVDTPKKVHASILKSIEDAGDFIEDVKNPEGLQKALPWIAAVAGSVTAGIIVARLTQRSS